MGSPFLYLTMSAIGVIFLGTPHRGSPSSKWGEILVRCGRTLGLKSDDRILKDLHESSEVLTDLLYPFTIWLFRMSVDVFCFYEQHETNYGERFGTKWKELVSIPSSISYLPCLTFRLEGCGGEKRMHRRPPQIGLANGPSQDQQVHR